MKIINEKKETKKVDKKQPNSLLRWLVVIIGGLGMLLGLILNLGSPAFLIGFGALMIGDSFRRY